MGSVSSVNPGVANLLQTLSNDGDTELSSPNVTSALQSAPVSDIVQLSLEATELANVGGLFGLPISPPATPSLLSCLANITANALAAGTTSSTVATSSSLATSSASATAATAASANQSTNEQELRQQEETQGLFGTAAGSVLNTTA